MPTRTCSRCRKRKSLDLFVRDRAYPTGYRKLCKSCKNQKQRNSLTDTLRKAYQRNTIPGISISPPTRPKSLKCEITTCASPTRICFEHDHKTGKFRGWLCAKCNTILSYANDSPERLRALADYLDKHNSKG